MKNVVVEGFEWEFDSPLYSGDINITPGQVSQNVKFDGKGAYKTLNFSILNFTGGAIDVNKSGAAVGCEIRGSSKYCKVEGQPMILEGDTSSSIIVNGLQKTESGSRPAQCVVTVKIKKAGQNKVQAE